MKKVLVIYGPTATGKTNLAISISKKYKGEIISADSRQVYKSLDIGTGKVDFKSRVEKFNNFWLVNGEKIYGFDLVEAGENFSVADFLKFANDSIEKISKNNKLPIVAGGTGFYLKALVEDIDTIGVPKNTKLRTELEKYSKEELLERLLKIDSSKAKAMNDSDSKNPRRLIRAIEVASYIPKTKVPKKSKDTDFLTIGLTAPNEHLYNKVDNWLGERFKNGLFLEVQNLVKKVNPKWLDSLGLEYRWLTKVALGEISLEDATERLKGDIHDFVRRQKTWFTKFPNIVLFDITSKNWQEELDKTVSLWYNQAVNDRYKNPD